MKLTSIQALRGAAAIAVVLFHIWLLELHVYGSATICASFFKNGWAGVDLFFVLSGFVMVKVTQGKFASIKNTVEFLYDRIFRIFPLYWVLTSLILVLLAIKPQLFHSMGHPSLISSFLLFPQLNQNPFLGQAWTLVFEMYFYYVFAFFMILLESRVSYALCSWAVLLAALNLLARGESQSALINLVASPLSLEFILGCFVAKIIYSGFERYAAAAGLVSATCILTGAFAVVTHPDEHVSPWERFFVFGIPFALLTYALVVLEQQGRLKPPGWLAKIGDFSYSLYLTHMIPIGALSRILPRQSFFFRVVNPLIMLSVTVVAGAACYYLLEKPLMRFVRAQKTKIFTERRVSPLAPAAEQVVY
jgi:exopolysaccharide production protein ExoZ